MRFHCGAVLLGQFARRVEDRVILEIGAMELFDHDFLTSTPPVACAVCAWRENESFSPSLPLCPTLRRWRAASFPGNASFQKPLALAARARAAQLQPGGRFRDPKPRAPDPNGFRFLANEQRNRRRGTHHRRRTEKRRLFLRVAAAAAQMVKANIGNDAIDPGVEGAFETKARQVAINL